MTWEPPAYPQQPGVPPPPPPAPPAYWSGGYSYAPPPKRLATGWIIAAAAGGLAVILLVVAAVSVHHRNSSGAKNATTQYLTDLQSGQYPAAYQMLCTSDLLVVPEATFVAAKTAVHPVSFSITSVAVGSNSESATVYYVETKSDGTGGSAALSLLKLSGVWRPCHGGQGGSWLNQDCGCNGTVDFPLAAKLDRPATAR